MSGQEFPPGEVDAQWAATLTDPPGVPWAMQMVVVSAEGVTHEQALTAAARAVVDLLQRAEQDPGSDLAAAVTRWREGLIRKVVRRAKPGAAWDRACQSLPAGSMSVATFEGAQVAAFCPGPVDQVPPGVARLQVSGLDLPRDVTFEEAGDGPVVWVSPYVSMSTGKACAQVAHAAQLLRESGAVPAPVLMSELRVAFPPIDRWAEYADRAPVVVRDAGFTEIPPGSRTAVAFDRPPA